MEAPSKDLQPTITIKEKATSSLEIQENGHIEEETNIIRITKNIPTNRKWKKPSESMEMVQGLYSQGVTPRAILGHLIPGHIIPADMTDEIAVQIIMNLVYERRSRDKISEFNTFNDAVELFRKSKNIIVLTGAGVSVSCGIPDFRSKNGIYARLHKDFPELPDPSSMFDIDFFKKNPAPFYNFAREIFPGQFIPSVSHMFIKYLEESGKLLRNYTQNIDTLEKIAGIQKVIECHGSFAKSTCLECKYEVDSEEIREDVLAQKISYCKKCTTGVMKPNIVFFGEDLGDDFHDQISEDIDKVDLLVVIGSSLKVQPVALIPYNIDPEVPQILINREVLLHYQADIKLLGNCDDIILELCMAIGGDIKEKMVQELQKREIPTSIYGKETNCLTPEEFKEIVDQPATKRSRMDEEENSYENMASFWESNYVPIETRLPKHSYLLLPPNINVFKGAEYFYDRDLDSFVRKVGAATPRSESPCNDSDESSSISSEDSESGLRRGGSLPPNAKIVPQEEIDEDFENVSICQRRGESEPPPLIDSETEYDSEELILRPIPKVPGSEDVIDFRRLNRILQYEGHPLSSLRYTA